LTLKLIHILYKYSVRTSREKSVTDLERPYVEYGTGKLWLFIEGTIWNTWHEVQQVGKMQNV